MASLLAGKRCLIVGGTGGLGLAAAARFLQEGARLAVAGRTPEETGRARDALEPLGPVHATAADATDARSIDTLFEDALSSLGGLDVLYHLVGASGRRHGDGPLHECSDDGWQATLAVNLTSTFLTNRAAVRHFLAGRQGGCILNMASVLALSPAPRHFDAAAYAAAKGGVLALTQMAAARYAPDGIRVNALAPGLIDTPMAARAVHDPAIGHYLRTKQPLGGGPGRPEDCAGAAVFLCSDAARFITGAVLPIDGGWCVSEGQDE